MAILGPVGCSAIGATYFGFKWIYRNKNKPNNEYQNDINPI